MRGSALTERCGRLGLPASRRGGARGRAAAKLGRLGAAAPTRAGGSPLSPREREALASSRGGRSNDEIAAALVLACAPSSGTSRSLRQARAVGPHGARGGHRLGA